MSNEFYDHTTFPVTGTSGSSAGLRAEFDKVETGFSKLPTMAGNAKKFLRVNAAGTAIEVTAALTDASFDGVVGGTAPAAGAFTTVDASGEVTALSVTTESVTTPLVTGLDSPTDPTDAVNLAYATALYGSLATAEESAQIAVAAAAEAAGWSGTSVTSLAIGTSTKSFTMSTSRQFLVGMPVMIINTSNVLNWMYGTVTSYDSATGAMVVDVILTNGSGTFADWTIILSGARGAPGGAVAFTRTATAVTVNCAPSDDATWLDCTSGTFDVTFSAAAALGSGWRRTIKNSGTGIITLNPSGAELVNGAATWPVHPDQTMEVQCDATQFRARIIDGPKGQIHVRDVKASGTHGGASAAATTFKRTLNTTVANTIPGASLAGDEVTLPAGVYSVEITVPAYNTRNQAWLYNETDGADLVLGTSSVGAAGSTNGNVYSFVSGRFTLSAAKNVSIKQYTVTSISPEGLGFAASTGKGEVYTDVIITKES